MDGRSRSAWDASPNPQSWLVIALLLAGAAVAATRAMDEQPPATGEGMAYLFRGIFDIFFQPEVDGWDDAINPQQATEETEQMLRAIWKEEFQFLVVASEPNSDQQAAISAKAEQAVKRLAPRTMAAMQDEQAGGFVRGPPGLAAPPAGESKRPAFNPREEIMAELARAASEELPDALISRYEAERRQRDASRKQMAIANLVADMDEALRFSAEQRTAIRDSLAEHWQPQWAAFVLISASDGFPNLPACVARDHLRPNQQAVWDELEKSTDDWVFLEQYGIEEGMLAVDEDDVVDEESERDPG